MNRHTPAPRMILLFSTLLLAAAPGLAGDKTSDDKVVFSGFLEDYSKLQSAEEFDLAFAYTKQPGILREYEKLHIPRVIFYFHASAEPVRVDADRLKELADYFHEELTEELGKVRELVGEPGPGVVGRAPRGGRGSRDGPADDELQRAQQDGRRAQGFPIVGQGLPQEARAHRRGQEAEIGQGRGWQVLLRDTLAAFPEKSLPSP